MSTLIILIITLIIVVIAIAIPVVIWYQMTPSQQSFQSQDTFPDQAISVKCPKCGTLMEEGYVPEYTYMQGILPDRWMKGKPEWRVWLTGVKVRDSNLRPISTYRCPGCGYLESYAR